MQTQTNTEKPTLGDTARRILERKPSENGQSIAARLIEQMQLVGTDRLRDYLVDYVDRIARKMPKLRGERVKWHVLNKKRDRLTLALDIATELIDRAEIELARHSNYGDIPGAKYGTSRECPECGSGLRTDTPYASDAIFVFCDNRESCGGMWRTDEFIAMANGELKRRQNAPHSLKVGDVLYSRSGATMTRYHFYRVIDTEPNRVRVAHLAKVATGEVDSPGYGIVRPFVERPNGTPINDWLPVDATGPTVRYGRARLSLHESGRTYHETYWD